MVPAGQLYCSQSKDNSRFYGKNEIKVLEWPSKSPDLNITEDICKTMSHSVYDSVQFSNVSELELAINMILIKI